MQIISKIFLFFISLICLFFLVFFTFITPSYDEEIKNRYQVTQTGIYEISWELTHYNIEKITSSWESTQLKMYNLSIWNNIYFYDGFIEIDTNNNIILWGWTYYFDINSLNFDRTINIDWSTIQPQWPGWFIVNTQHKVQKSIYSISSKVAIQLFDKKISEEESTLVDLYPNMFLMYNPSLNKQIINADLLRIQNVQYLDMINSPLYFEAINDNWEKYQDLHTNIKKYVFFQKEKDYNFIKNIFSFKKYQENKAKTIFIQLSKNNFYNFPWESYIIKYYSYFLNKEKKKIYYKNLILKELIGIINSKNKNVNQNNFNENIKILKELNNLEYQEIKDTINFYYENILLSQKQSPQLLTDITKLVAKLENKDLTINFDSLITLRSIYWKYHNWDITSFHKSLNIFIDQYKIQMNMSIYDENHRIHNYFLFYLKNILVADFSKVKDHNEIITLFNKYTEIKSVFIEKWNDVTKKTALFDNASLLKVFVNITKLNFFEKERDDKDLLVPLKPAWITNENYWILHKNLSSLLSFYKNNQYFIKDSSNRKDKILSLNYDKYSTELEEYFLALNNYNDYLLKYDDIWDLLPVGSTEELGLDKLDAILFLKQFNWVSSIDTDIQIRDYSYCLQPIEEYDTPITNIKDWYCYKIGNLSISWFIFSFILTPSEGNTITYLKYIDREWKEISLNINYQMDQLKEDMMKQYQRSQSSEKDQYDFSKFFNNNFINKNLIIDDIVVIEEKIDPFTPPKSNDSFQIRKLKTTLLWKNGYLEKIRSILPISYDYLIVLREDNEYKINIFPTNFELSIKWASSVNKFFGKFQWIYSYGTDLNDNTFKESSILIFDKNDRKNSSFLLNQTAININWEFTILETEEVLTKLLFPFAKIENIYITIYEKFPVNDFTMTYNIEKNTVSYDTKNTYKFVYNMEWLVDIYENNSKIDSIVYNKLSTYLKNIK